MSDVGNRIKSEREKQRISQRKLAILCGISQASISCIEAGKNDPSYEALTMISKVLNIPVSFFTGEKMIKDPIMEPLTYYPPERPLLMLYRSLNEQGQQVAMDMLRSLAMNPAFQRDNKKTAVPAV